MDEISDYVSGNGVTALDSRHAWAVGDGGTILFYGGSSWRAGQSGTANWLECVRALDKARVLVVGDSGTIVF